MTAAPSGQLVEALKDAHAREASFDDLESMIVPTRDREFVEMLRAHRRQTYEHARRLEARLADHSGKRFVMIEEKVGVLVGHGWGSRTF